MRWRSDGEDLADTEDPDVELGYYSGSLERLLLGIEAARFEHAVLGLDGGAAELCALVDERARHRPDLIENNRLHREGTRSFLRGRVVIGAARYLQLPIEGDNVAAVRSLLDHHADPEIAIELEVSDAAGPLLYAPDIGDNDMWISSRVPRHSVEALRAALGDDLTPRSDPA